MHVLIFISEAVLKMLFRDVDFNNGMVYLIIYIIGELYFKMGPLNEYINFEILSEIYHWGY